LEELVVEYDNRDKHGSNSEELEQIECRQVDHEENHHKLSAEGMVVSTTGNHGTNIGNDLVSSE